MEIIQFVADALGDASYLLVDGTSAAVVDPQRDVRPFIAAAESRSATIDYVFETHVHNDYLSGGRELASRGAQVVAPAGRLEFPHLGVADGDGITIGGTRVVTVAAPGHTYEHVAYLAEQGGTARGAFTGGALLMAAVGRSDLLTPADTPQLLRLQWTTAQRLRGLLPPEAAVMPTHGAGSFCSATGAGLDRMGPLSAELGRNPAFVEPNLEAFMAFQLASSAPIPAYYQFMAPMNRRGPAVFGAPPAANSLDAPAVRAMMGNGAALIDTRPRSEFAQGHIPGAFSVEADASFLAYVSWVTAFNAPLVLVTHDSEQAERLTIDLFRIGYEDVRGWLHPEAWDGKVERFEAVGAADVATALPGGVPVLDVRFGDEHRSQPVPGAIQLPIDRIAQWADSAPDDCMVFCASGYRASVAASYLARAGKRVRPLLDGGAASVLAVGSLA